MSDDGRATFYTISDYRFFVGTVALLNSLRLTGNEGPLVVLDSGLTEAQRARLEKHVQLVKPSGGVSRQQFKAYPLLLDPSGVIVIIDSDMIVTRSLSYVVDGAANGKICVFPDHFLAAGRWFKEWETTLELKSPLRRGQTYVNGGFIALSTERWPHFLGRLWDVSGRVPADEMFSMLPMEQRPFTGGDQDPLNALLMSEIPGDAVQVMPPAQEAFPDELLRTRVIDPRTLACTLDGERTAILHHSLGPKAWHRIGWTRVLRDAYVRLLPRVLCGPDVPLRMDPRELPVWLRPSLTGKGVLAALDVTHRAWTPLRRRLPPRASDAVFRAKRWFLVALKRSRKP